MIDQVVIEIVLVIGACAAAGTFAATLAWHACAAVWRRLTRRD